MIRGFKYACALSVASLLAFSSAGASTTASPGGSVSFTGALSVTDSKDTPTTVVCTLNLVGTINASTSALSFTQANIPGDCDTGGDLWYQTSIELGTATSWTAAAPTKSGGVYHYTLTGFSITSDSLFGPFAPWTCASSISNVNFDNINETLTIPSTNISGTNGRTCTVSGTLYASPFQTLSP